MSERLAGKVAFITGAARGQGRAHAVRMAKEGADIIAIDIAAPLPPSVPYDSATPQALAETVRLVEATGRRILAAAADTRDLDALRTVVDKGVAEFGRLDIIIANAGITVQPFMVHYTASKHGVTGLARAFAAELGKHRIRVNSLHPGAVNTPMGTGDMMAALNRANETNPGLMQMVTPFLPDWIAEPEDIADAACWLASDESRFVTASKVAVDLGSTQF